MEKREGVSGKNLGRLGAGPFAAGFFAAAMGLLAGGCEGNSAERYRKNPGSGSMPKQQAFPAGRTLSSSAG